MSATTSTASDDAYATGDRCQHHRAPVMCPHCDDRSLPLAAAYNLREEYRLATADLEDFDPRNPPSEDRIPASSIPCPSWCTLPGGHGYDSFDAALGEPWREHAQSFDERDQPFSVDITCRETLTRDGMTRTDPALQAYEAGRDLTSDQVRAFAAALQRAAASLDVVENEA